MEQTMKVVLELQDQPSNVRRITVRHDIVIGRGSDCNLRLSAPQISRRHCFLRVSRDGVSVTDLDSSNGTYLDGKRLKPGKREDVANGASLSLGPIRFIIHVRDEAVSADVLKPAPQKDAVAPAKSPMSLGIERAAPSAEPDESTASLSGPAKALRMAMGDFPPDMLSRAEIIDLGKLKDSAHGPDGLTASGDRKSPLDELPTVATGSLDNADVLDVLQEPRPSKPDPAASLADATWFSGGDSANSMPVISSSDAAPSATAEDVEEVEVLDEFADEVIADVEVVDEFESDYGLASVEVIEDVEAVEVDVIEDEVEVLEADEVIEEAEIVEEVDAVEVDDVDPELRKFLKGF